MIDGKEPFIAIPASVPSEHFHTLFNICCPPVATFGYIVLEFMTNGKQINVILFNQIVVNSGVEVDMSALLPQHGRAIHTAKSGQRFSWPGNKILTSTSLTTWILSHHWSWNSAQIVCSDFTKLNARCFSKPQNSLTVNQWS